MTTNWIGWMLSVLVLLLWRSRKLTWDGEKQEFIKDQEANAITKATYREPWGLPKV